MNTIEKAAIYYNPSLLDTAVKQNLPPLLEVGIKRRTIPPSKVQLTGFWSKIDYVGSKLPICRENAVMLSRMYNGQEILVLLGGTTSRYGIFDFEAFSFNIYKR